jgi:peptide-methionine (S)-S-oxide reductase
MAVRLFDRNAWIFDRRFASNMAERVVMSRNQILLLTVVALTVVLMGYRRMSAMPAATRSTPIPAPQYDAPLAQQPGSEKAVFAGGCFWGTQSVFQRVKGVIHTEAGYSGGSASTATYDQVTTETTGHAESVEITFDPSKITYGTLLRIFFSVAHDPTQLNRQGPDVGTSYRSAIFYENEEQHKIAQQYIQQLDNEHAFSGKIVTELTPLKAFYKGEDYHQDYATKNPGNPYIQVCDIPKMAALKAQFPELFQTYKGH